MAQISPSGRPRNAVTMLWICSAVLLCPIIPSAVAFTSLLSAGYIPLIAAYGLVALLRLTLTPNAFKSRVFPLGKARKWMYAVAVIFNALLVVVRRIGFWGAGTTHRSNAP